MSLVTVIDLAATVQPEVRQSTVETIPRLGSVAWQLSLGPLEISVGDFSLLSFALDMSLGCFRVESSAQENVA